MEETISRMAGSENGSAKSVEELVAIAEGIGRPARQRTTTYTPLAARPRRPITGRPARHPVVLRGGEFG
jgi:2-iminoacetate synthase ThiH